MNFFECYGREVFNAIDETQSNPGDIIVTYSEKEITPNHNQSVQPDIAPVNEESENTNRPNKDGFMTQRQKVFERQIAQAMHWGSLCQRSTVESKEAESGCTGSSDQPVETKTVQQPYRSSRSQRKADKKAAKRRLKKIGKGKHVELHLQKAVYNGEEQQF